jgi:hypothetical protein
VAQNGPLAAREQRRLLDRERRRDPVADQIHAAMDLVETSVVEPQLDLMARHAGGQELPSSDHSVLARRDCFDHAIRNSSE